MVWLSMSACVLNIWHKQIGWQHHCCQLHLGQVKPDASVTGNAAENSAISSSSYSPDTAWQMTLQMTRPCSWAHL